MSLFDRATTLLLVDDYPSMVRLLAKIIERSFGDRMELHSLTDPKAARRWIEENLVDILVTDLEMPGVSGLELLHWAKRKNPCSQVLFVTGHSTLEALTDALELGATDYLLKPLDQTELIALVEDADRRLRRWRKALAGTVAAGRE
jgi:DNA-binding NtrC family response regulator